MTVNMYISVIIVTIQFSIFKQNVTDNRRAYYLLSNYIAMFVIKFIAMYVIKLYSYVKYSYVCYQIVYLL